MQLTQHGVGITCILTVLDTVLSPLLNEIQAVSVRYIYGQLIPVLPILLPVSRVRPGMSNDSPLLGISWLSFCSFSLSPLSISYLVLLLYLSSFFVLIIHSSVCPF